MRARAARGLRRRLLSIAAQVKDDETFTVTLSDASGATIGTPNAGFGLSGSRARDYRIGWRLTSVVRGDPGFELSLDATRSEPASDNGAGVPEHGVMLRAGIRW